MALFQSVLLLLAILSLQVSRRLRIPYPTMLAVAGHGVVMLPSAPTIAIEPSRSGVRVHFQAEMDRKLP
jgi:CPA1 family monovalent cation:H+ antiporter